MRINKRFLRFMMLPLLAAVFFTLVAADGDTPVFATSTGSRYHRETCSTLRSSRIPITLAEAVRRGLQPCNICHPPVLGSDPVVADARPAARASRGGAPGLYRVNEAELRNVQAADLSRALPVEVIRHVDGDTVGVQIANPPEGLSERETIRLIGVDTPETVHPTRQVEQFGREASEYTRQQLFGKQVFLVFDWDLRDRYGRLLAYIYTAPGQCYNLRVIQEGYGHAYTSFPFQFMEEFREAERAARSAKRGLWGD